MKKKNNYNLILTTIVCLLPMIFSAIVYADLPSQIAVHFNASGQADSYASKLFVAFGIPALMAAVNMLLYFTMEQSAKRKSGKRLLAVAQWIIPIMSLLLVPLTLLIALDSDLPIEIITPAIVGVLLMLIGNYLPKYRQNQIVGIRLPWTKKSEENWNRTHRFAGLVFVLGGGLIVILSFLSVSVWVLAAIGVLIVIAPALFSYLLSKQGH